MSQQNPYLPPQASLTAADKVPMASVSLPREMLVVASGMRLILWAIVVMFFAWVAWYVVNRMSNNAIQQMGQNPDLEQIVSLALRPLYVLGGLTLLSHILNLLGLFKCTQIPEVSGAKGLALIAFLSTAVALACSLGNYFLQYQALKTLELPGSIVMYLGAISGILGIVSLLSFLLFLKKTSLYLGDALAIERSKDLIKRYIALVVIMLVSAGFFFYASKSNMPIESFGLVLLCLAVLFLVMALWTFIIYLRTLNRIRVVVEAGVR